MNDCELILRFFALRDTLPSYAPPLKTLLNGFMRANRNPEGPALNELRTAFLTTVESVSACFAEHPFRRAQVEEGVTIWDRSLNRAVFDAQMMVFEGVDAVWVRENSAQVVASFVDLCVNDQRFNDCLSRATADKSRMDYRLATWNATVAGMGATLPMASRIPPLPASEKADGE